MALVYPLALPDVPLNCTSFELDLMAQSSVTGGGEDFSVERGAALWHGVFTTPLLRGLNFKIMSAWKAAVESPPKRVWAWDTRCNFPFAYQKIGFTGLVRAVGGTSFDGTATLGTVADGKSVPLSGFPAGFVLGPGDYISYAYDGGRQACHRIAGLALVTADSSGMMTVEVRPAVRAGWTSGASVSVLKPKIQATIIPNSFRCSRDASQMGTFSFEVKQTLRQVAS